jgi:hypothetical protein
MGEKRYFQYLAGPYRGEIVIFDKIEEEDDMIFISFTDGSRVNEEFIQPKNLRKYDNKIMAEIDDPTNPWTFKEEWIGRQEEKTAQNADGEVVVVQPFIEGKQKVTPIPPKKLKSTFGEISNKFEIIKKEKSVKEKIDLSDPVFLMMEKAKKKDIQVDMQLVLSLPSKDLYNVAKESFENGGEKVIEYIIKNIKKKDFENALKNALKNAYEDVEVIEQNETTVIEEPIIGKPIIAETSQFINNE